MRAIRTSGSEGGKTVGGLSYLFPRHTVLGPPASRKEVVLSRITSCKISQSVLQTVRTEEGGQPRADARGLREGEPVHENGPFAPGGRAEATPYVCALRA
jgi:hypothetical protein